MEDGEGITRMNIPNQFELFLHFISISFHHLIICVGHAVVLGGGAVREWSIVSSLLPWPNKGWLTDLLEDGWCNL